MEKSDSMELLRHDIKHVPRLIAGLLLLGLGIHTIRLSSFGLPPWAVLHDGIEQSLQVPFGYNTLIVGVIVLVFSIIVFRTKVGIATILNVLLVGPFIELLRLIVDEIHHTLFRDIVVFLLGFICMTFGRALYISSNLGQGPRDGLFIGIARTTPIPVKYVKLGVEFIVLLLGYLMGGDVFIGTAIVVVASGYMIQGYFAILGYNPKEHHNHSIVDYMRPKKESS
ncbi:YczE/YyaS/YitT family protein [Candidatus Xianfuyuplasma coldseepsis]|uniref:Membrane protein n=1 Tax=Candidatus Xianfuyuplasma coldseepsis TaxID=2782163 RepID=A0A7L7KPU9_9MOLU|nr:membrane protein [Xianfuyuplasma coldseepsis]QMS84206.1 membrane protein [Xianfuyuplasma coldseepsis]